ncbi:hypothetical protein E2P81_ATG10456 [Venturia nashicola]|nr:hypothetical protein E2P81_ATG10456 [Venturia nashicola]
MHAVTAPEGDSERLYTEPCFHRASVSSMSSSASGSNRQNAAQKRSHRSPEQPPGGKSRRTLIESACTACQKRKSRCDGQRPTCSRCQALRTPCGYNAEEGESRWSALRRRNRTLERERDEARDVIAQIHSRSDSDAQQIFHQLRADPNNRDLGNFIHDVASNLSREGSQSQADVQQQQVQTSQPPQGFYNEQHNRQYDSTYPYQQQQQLPETAQRPQPVQNPAQQQDQTARTQSGFPAAPTATQLPPIRSMVELPPGGINPPQFPLPFAPRAQRHMSQASAVSSGSYSDLSSSEGHHGQSLSPQEVPSNWMQGPQR